LLPNAYDRLMAYREALEARFGEQPDNALVFQVLSNDGPLWYEDGFPVGWSADDYKRWTARVWRPARTVAARAPDTEDWIAGLTFYELRHSAISTALHSTLVMSKDGMNLHTLAAYAGHDVQTLQRYYAHVIARYRTARPISLEVECEAARHKVEASPFQLADRQPGPQRDAQRADPLRRYSSPSVDELDAARLERRADGEGEVAACPLAEWHPDQRGVELEPVRLRDDCDIDAVAELVLHAQRRGQPSKVPAKDQNVLVGHCRPPPVLTGGVAGARA
jgi:hypothetical protein